MKSLKAESQNKISEVDLYSSIGRRKGIKLRLLVGYVLPKQGNLRRNVVSQEKCSTIDIRWRNPEIIPSTDCLGPIIESPEECD